MKWITLKDGSKWPDPNYKDSVYWNPMAEAYKELIMGNLTLQQVRDKISLIRQAAGRKRIPPRKSKKAFLYNEKWYTWKEIAEMGVDGLLTRDIIVSRQRAGKTMDEIISTPVRKHIRRKPRYEGFANKEDHYALHECDREQRITLGLA